MRIHVLSDEIAKVPLPRLTPEHLERFFRKKQDGGFSPRTVHHLRAIIRAALAVAVKRDRVAKNVAALVDPPRVEEHEIRALTPDEAKHLLVAVSGDRLETLHVLSLATGLRQGEALGLRWSDLNMDGGTLTVRMALQRIRGAFQLVEPKTRTSRRTIAVP